MKDFKVLKFLDKFKGLFSKIGIDYAVMRKILQVKLTMDNRRSSTMFKGFNNNNNSDTAEKSSFIKSLGIYVFLGVFLTSFIFIPIPSIYSMSWLLGVIMFFVTLTMIADFSSVMLDIRDKNILLTRPVDYRTLNMAKTIHIIIYISTIIGAISICPLAASLFRNGIIFFLVFIFELILISVFIVFLTSIIYYIILSLFDGEKLKDIINYVQITLTVVIALGQQLLGRVFQFTNLKIVFTPKWWSYFIAPLWMGAPFSIVKDKTSGESYYYLTACGIIIPLLMLIVYVKFMAPYFERKLLKLSSTGGSKKKNGFKNRLQLKIAKIVCREKVEQAVYNFSMNMLSSERKLKLQIYPNLVMSIIFPFLFIIPMVSEAKSIGEFFTLAGSGKKYFLLYFTAVFLSLFITLICRSDNYKAAWLYKASPIENPEPILRGSVKAILMKFTIPVFLIGAVIFIALCGIRIIPDLIVIFINVFLITCIIFLLSTKQLPFSKEFTTRGQQANASTSLICMAIAGGIGVIHYILSFINYANIVYGIAMLIITVFLWSRMFNVSWEDIQ